MQLIKSSLIAISLATAFTSHISAAVTPQTDYNLGSSSFLTASDNTFFSTGDVYVFYGVFTTVPTPTSTAQEIKNDFIQLGLSTDNPYAGHVFSSSVNELDFQSKQGYLLTSNNADIGLATEMSIISNSVDPDWTFADNLTGTPAVQAINTDDVKPGVAGAEIILGTRGTTSEGFDTILLVSVVPEPSSIALLGIGVFAVILRRKK